MFFRQSRHTVLCKADYKTGDAPMRHHVEKLRHHTFQQMFVRPQSSQTCGRDWHSVVAIFFADFRQLGKEDERSYGKEKSCNHKVSSSDSGSFGCLIRLKLGGRHGGQLRARMLYAGKNEGSANDGSDDCADRVERLRQVHATFRTLRWAKDRQVRIFSH